MLADPQLGQVVLRLEPVRLLDESAAHRGHPQARHQQRVMVHIVHAHVAPQRAFDLEAKPAIEGDRRICCRPARSVRRGGCRARRPFPGPCQHAGAHAAPAMGTQDTHAQHRAVAQRRGRLRSQVAPADHFSSRAAQRRARPLGEAVEHDAPGPSRRRRATGSPGRRLRARRYRARHESPRYGDAQSARSRKSADSSPAFGVGMSIMGAAILARRASRVIGQSARAPVAKSLILQDALGSGDVPAPGSLTARMAAESWARRRPSQLAPVKDIQPRRAWYACFISIDASVFIFRAYYSVPIDVADRDGNPVNAVHGFARFLGELLERELPVQIAVAFDESLEVSYRNEIYPGLQGQPRACAGRAQAPVRAVP